MQLTFTILGVICMCMGVVMAPIGFWWTVQTQKLIRKRLLAERTPPYTPQERELLQRNFSAAALMTIGQILIFGPIVTWGLFHSREDLPNTIVRFVAAALVFVAAAIGAGIVASHWKRKTGALQELAVMSDASPSLLDDAVEAGKAWKTAFRWFVVYKSCAIVFAALALWLWAK
ncbi:MAG: hypothetical protein Greene041619_800 [Candidatus Peregrinibacteria bacterium Greene0416_19]|nr:MAG: hypothetical protein Greene041619_800 [Candidatus Peregrinibacteria bacterium Greene0416_19]